MKAELRTNLKKKKVRPMYNGSKTRKEIQKERMIDSDSEESSPFDNKQTAIQYVGPVFLIILMIGLFVLFMIVFIIGLFSLLPGQSIRSFSYMDHAIAYFGFTFLLSAVFRHAKVPYLRERHYVLPLLIVICLGNLMEYLQGFAPGRTPDTVDSIYNMMGAFSAQGARAILRIPKSLRKWI